MQTTIEHAADAARIVTCAFIAPVDKKYSAPVDRKKGQWVVTLCHVCNAGNAWNVGRHGLTVFCSPCKDTGHRVIPKKQLLPSVFSTAAPRRQAAQGSRRLARWS